MKTSCVLIKTTSRNLVKLQEMLSNEKNLLIIALNDYIHYMLKKNSISSTLLKHYSIFRNYRDLEKHMEKQYKRLCNRCNTELDYADLFLNHLCWETQKAYYFLSTFNEIRKRLNVIKVFYDCLPEEPNNLRVFFQVRDEW